MFTKGGIEKTLELMGRLESARFIDDERKRIIKDQSAINESLHTQLFGLRNDVQKLHATEAVAKGLQDVLTQERKAHAETVAGLNKRVSEAADLLCEASSRIENIVKAAGGAKMQSANWDAPDERD